MTQPSLAELQHWLQAVVTHPGGVVEGIDSEEAQRRVPIPAEAINSVVLPSKSLTSHQRLAVYSNAYFGRLLECMRELFPALRYALEEEVFDQFAVGYLTTYPPQSYTLAKLSDRFVPFLEETRAKIAAPEETWPDFVIDLARLEWQIEEVFDGPGTENLDPLSPEELSRTDPESFAAARLQLAPCLRMLPFRFPVNDYYTAWRGLDSGGEERIPLPDPQPDYLALTRRNYVVRRFPLSEPQFRLLTALAAGETVGEAIAAAAGDEGEAIGGELGRWFQQWTAAGFFVGCMPSGG